MQFAFGIATATADVPVSPVPRTWYPGAARVAVCECESESGVHVAQASAVV